MSIYQKIAEVGTKFLGKDKVFKYGFNLSPMYRRSTGRIIYVSKDLLTVKIKIPISWKNRNYVNTIFGGSMFSAVDPIPMVQLMNIIGKDYVVWDKSAEIQFKKPANVNLFAEFKFSDKELLEIQTNVRLKNEIEIKKITHLTNKAQTKTYCTVTKTLYIANRTFYKQKLKKRKKSQ